MGPGVTVETVKDQLVASRSATEGWGNLLTDQWFSKGSDGYDKARVVLEIVELGGEIRLGVTMKNYRASNMDDDISKNRNATVLVSETGMFTRKGTKPDQIYKPVPQLPLKVGDRIVLAVDIGNDEMMKCEVLRKNMKGQLKSMTNTNDVDLEDQGGGLDKVGHELAVVLAIGPVTEAGKATRVRIVGSSSSKTPKGVKSAPDTKEAASEEETKVDPMVAAAQSSGA
jgi:hypothetical protein